MLQPEQVRAVVEEYLKAVSSGEAEQVLAIYHPEATVEDPVGSGVRRGREALAEFYNSLPKGMETTLREVRVAGNEAMFLFDIVTRNDGKTVVISPIDHMTFDDEGKVRTMRAFWSNADVKIS